MVSDKVKKLFQSPHNSKTSALMVFSCYLSNTISLLTLSLLYAIRIIMMKHHACGHVTFTKLGKPNTPGHVKSQKIGTFQQTSWFPDYTSKDFNLTSNLFNGLLPHLVFNATELQTISTITLVICLRVSTCSLVQVLNLSANACT